MKTLLMLAGLAEAATGVALLIAPSLVGRLLLGAELAGAAIPVARVTGIALLALGVGCSSGSLWLGMWTYTALATLYLAYLGVGTEWSGTLLWPAVAAHAVLTVLLARGRGAGTPPPTPARPEGGTAGHACRNEPPAE